MFLDALRPLRDSGRMGAILMQYPRWVGPSREHAALIEEARSRLEGWRAAVEFRNKGWFDDRLRTRTLDLLRRTASRTSRSIRRRASCRGAPVPEATSPNVAIVRFHGRNTDTWEAKVTRSASAFATYTTITVARVAPMIRAISEQTEEVHLVFTTATATTERRISGDAGLLEWYVARRW